MGVTKNIVGHPLVRFGAFPLHSITFTERPTNNSSARRSNGSIKTVPYTLSVSDAFFGNLV
jgi:hypothetical protein